MTKPTAEQIATATDLVNSLSCFDKRFVDVRDFERVAQALADEAARVREEGDECKHEVWVACASVDPLYAWRCKGCGKRGKP